MFYTSSLGYLIVLGLLVTISRAAQSPHSATVDQPKECAENQNFCMAFCLSTNPGTVRARCGKDKTSCICTTKAGHSVKVRFIEERKPVPPTRRPPPNQIQQHVNSEPAYQSHQPYQPNHQNPAWNAEVPQLLVCDGAEVHREVCHRFCTYNIGASMGVCNLTDFTCSCIGVSPAVVQDVPIPAIFTENIFMTPESTTSVPVTTPPPMMQYYHQQEPQQYWSPITPNHPNYYYSQTNHQYPHFQQALRTQQMPPPPEYPPTESFQTQHQLPQPMDNEPWRPIVNGQLYQFHQQTQPGVLEGSATHVDPITNAPPPTSNAPLPPPGGIDGHNSPSVSTSAMVNPTPVVSAESNVSSFSIGENVEVHETHRMSDSAAGQSQNLPMQLALDKYENHRNKRSKRSYASVLSYGISHTPSCHGQMCKQQCDYSGYGDCEATCVEEKCICMCTPDLSMEDVKKTVYPLRGKQPGQKNPGGQLNVEYSPSGTPPPPPAFY